MGPFFAHWIFINNRVEITLLSGIVKIIHSSMNQYKFNKLEDCNNYKYALLITYTKQASGSLILQIC